MNDNQMPKPAKGAPASAPVDQPQPKVYDLSKFSDLIEVVRAGDDEILKQVQSYIDGVVARYEGLGRYTVLFLYDDHDSISQYHSNAIYNAASAVVPSTDILLIVQSAGGHVEPGYLISRTCKRLAKSKFVVAVPRQAKSAATLIALGADEVHMGLMSELGPIDPQIGGYPALGLSNALHKVAELACAYPESAQMWATYLGNNLNLRHLGYLERLNESAGQYAERLLTNKAAVLPAPHTPASLASHLVTHYKDHGFVIDSDEALSLLGSGIIKTGTPEYKCANEIFGVLYLLAMVMRLTADKEFYYVGAVHGGMTIREVPKKK